MIRNRFSSNSEELYDLENLNPMESVANIADAMLVLAVGIMLALVTAWNVDIGGNANVTKLDKAEEVADDQIVLNGSDDEFEQLDALGLSEYGTVYQDADGNFYVMKDDYSGDEEWEDEEYEDEEYTDDEERSIDN